MASSKSHLVGSTNHKCYHKCLSGRGNLLSTVKAFVLLSKAAGSTYLTRHCSLTPSTKSVMLRWWLEHFVGKNVLYVL